MHQNRKSDGAMGKGMNYSEKESYKQGIKLAKGGKQIESKGSIKGFRVIKVKYIV